MSLRARNPFLRSRGGEVLSAGAATPIPGLGGAMYDPDRESVVRTTEQFWIRPHPTFDRVGLHGTANTVLVVEAYTPHVQGNLRLWRVRGTRSGTVGYAAFTEDSTGTTGFESTSDFPWRDVPIDNTPLRGGASPANPSRPRTDPVSPPPAAPRATPRSSSSPVFALAALMGLGALGVVLWRNRKKLGG